jgi:carbon monoxide dehydrogenase subunit G
MREYWVEVNEEVSNPREAVFEFLAEHENLGPLLGGANISRVRDGDTERNGVGSVRRVKVGPARPFEETITKFEPHSLIEYRITKGGPLRNHIGIVALSDVSGGGTNIDYRIRIASHIPGLAPLVRRKLTHDITRSIAKLDSQLSAD